jgi:membrane associated rhomboid family serine protease
VWGIIPIPAPILVLIYTIIELGSQFFTVSNVAHFTHLFGFLTAWLYFVIRMGIHPIKIWKNAYK